MMTKNVEERKYSSFEVSWNVCSYYSDGDVRKFRSFDVHLLVISGFS